MKKSVLVLSALLSVSFLLPLSSVYAAQKTYYSFNSKQTVKDKKNVSFNKEITALELAEKMNNGWNLGNTMDANGSRGMESETSWGQPLTTKEMLQAIADSGVKTIRIPCSWANHIVDNNYTIDSTWMKRVKQIVDWSIEAGLYVILNDHHDNYDKEGLMPRSSGYYPSSLNWNESMLFLKNLWAQISITFNSGYDEHLIFEVMNEPRLRGHEHEWWYNQNCNICKNGAANLNKLNQLCLDTIRSSGKNNANRFVMITGLAASIQSYQADDSFVLPKDSAKDKLMISVHLYTPYNFAMENPGSATLNEKHLAELTYDFDWLNEHFVSKGIPVIIGEYGATNKNNIEERVKWFTFFVSNAHKYGMCPILWDNGDWDAKNTYEEKFGFFDRREFKWFFPEIMEAILNN